ncbi:MAG: SIMPL domain-containing protein, partial [Archangium sp.]
MPAARTALLLALLLSTLATGASAQPRPTPPIPAPPPLVNPSQPTLRVEGTGEVKAAPDEAFLDLAVETQAPTAKAAAAENARKI